MKEIIKYSKPTIALFKEWNENDVLYCHWKSTDHLDASFIAKTDLDVLIDSVSTKKAIEIALSLGFIELKSSHFRGYPSVKDFVLYDEALNRWVHLHFHIQLICGDRWVKAYHLPFEKLVLENRVKHFEYDMWNISPQYELLIFIYRMNAKFKKNWLHDKRIQEEIKYIIGLKDKYPINLDESIKKYIGKEAIEIFDKFFKNSIDFKNFNIQKIRKEFNVSEFRRMSATRFFFLSKFRFSYRVYAEIRKRKFKIYSSGRRSFPNGGIIVAFVGIDGSGKTTGIKRVTKKFASHMNVQCNFLGSGKSGASWPRKLIMNLIGFKAKFKGHKKIRKQGAEKITDASDLKKPPIYYLLWIWLVTRDREKQLKNIQRGLANGKLVFVDRWLQDSVPNALDAARLANYCESDGLTGKIARREHVLYQKIKLLPLHQVVKLNITPEISVDRKPGELTLKGAKNAIEKLNSISWPSETHISEIDATKDVEHVTNNMIYSIWNRIKEHN